MSPRLFLTHHTFMGMVAVVALATHSTATAQTPQRPPRGAPSLTFVGLGIAAGEHDAAARQRQPQETSAVWPKVEAGVRLTRFVGVGAEVSAYPETAGDFQLSLGRVQVRDRQRELLITGLVRAQTTFGRQAMALAAGVGALRQTRDGSFTACDVICISGETAAPQRTSLAWLAGVDYALRLTPHLDLGAGLRLHVLRRGVPAEPLFPFANSTPFSVSLSLRLGS